MAQTYSYDLREKALRLVDQKMGAQKVARLFSVSRSSIFLWKKRREVEGSTALRKDWRKGYRTAVKDLEAFKAFVDKNKGLTAQKMAEMWGTTLKTMRKWLKRIGYSSDLNPIEHTGVKAKKFRRKTQ